MSERRRTSGGMAGRRGGKGPAGAAGSGVTGTGAGASGAAGSGAGGSGAGGSGAGASGAGVRSGGAGPVPGGVAAGGGPAGGAGGPAGGGPRGGSGGPDRGPGGGSGGGSGGTDQFAGLSGPELAHAVLDAAKARRNSTPRARRFGDGSGRRPRGYSGPGPDPRDPQPFAVILAKLVKSRGWQRPAAEGLIFGDWAKVVGPDVAAHCHPVKLTDGELTVEAESTAWATELRLLSGRLLAGIAAAAGRNVVTRLHIHGPAAPTWSRGARRVRGRGPRDTYG